MGVVSFDDLLWRLTQELADLAAVVDAVRKIPETFHGTRQAPLLEG
jgi:hypothetical protein